MKQRKKDVNDVNQEPMTLRLNASRTTDKCPTPGRAGSGFLTNPHRRDWQDDKCPGGRLLSLGKGNRSWYHGLRYIMVCQIKVPLFQSCSSSLTVPPNIRFIAPASPKVVFFFTIAHLRRMRQCHYCHRVKAIELVFRKYVSNNRI